jgi:dnd system-associated protein 4
MAERRIGYSKDKSEILKRLVAGEESTGPFELIADALAFAAALGLRRNRRMPLGKETAEPIRQEVFDRRGYDTMMNLVVLHADQRPEALADSEQGIEARARAFEEYANGGLEILQEELKGAVNTAETTVLLINAERPQPSDSQAGFDLRQLVS